MVNVIDHCRKCQIILSVPSNRAGAPDLYCTKCGGSGPNGTRTQAEPKYAVGGYCVRLRATDEVVAILNVSRTGNGKFIYIIKNGPKKYPVYEEDLKPYKEDPY